MVVALGGGGGDCTIGEGTRRRLKGYSGSDYWQGLAAVVRRWSKESDNILGIWVVALWDGRNGNEGGLMEAGRPGFLRSDDVLAGEDTE